MRTCVRVRSRDHPACRPRLVLRLGRTTRRPAPARPSRDRGRGRRRSRRQLRGESLRRRDGDVRARRPRPVPGGDRRSSPHARVHAGQPRRVRGVRADHATRRGALHRRSLPRRRRPVADRRHPGGHRRPAAARRRRTGRVADHGGGGPDQVPRQGRERRREAGRAAGGATRPGTRVPASVTGRTAVGRRQGDRRDAARARPPPRGRPRAGERGRTRRAARQVGGTPSACAGARTRSAARPAPPSAPVRGGAARPRPAPQRRRTRSRVGRRDPADAGGTGHRPHACGRACRPHRGAAPALRRLLPGDAIAHAARNPRPARTSSSAPRGNCSASRSHWSRTGG